MRLRRFTLRTRRLALALALAAIPLLVAWSMARGPFLALWRYPREPSVMEVPVRGLRPSDLRSTWHAPRSGGRLHEGVDIFARRGTPVVSAVHGTVWRVGEDRLGGRVVVVLGEGRTLYYYAHLDSVAPGLARGDDVFRGQVLGGVGTSGNARGTPPHLHFGMYRLGWLGLSAVDPVPVLTAKARVPDGRLRPRVLRDDPILSAR